MKALGMIEVYSYTTAVCTADVAAKAADVRVIAFDRNRPLSADVPAPLVMVVKLEGETAAVRAAVDAGVAYAQEKGRYIVSHMIPRPAEDAEKMAYLMDVNKDRFNRSFPKSFHGCLPEPKPAGEAIGLLETQGLVASIEGLDTMLKTANVRLIHTEKRLGGRLVTLVVAGEVSAVSQSLESGRASASRLGRVYGCETIPNPHGELTKFFDFSVPEERE